MTTPQISEADRLVMADELRHEMLRRAVELALTPGWSELVAQAAERRHQSCYAVQIVRYEALAEQQRTRNGERRERARRDPADVSVHVGAWPL